MAKIGVFDSGIGGLTVVKALRRVLPDDDIIYLGDTARTPYGSKSGPTIVRYSLNNAGFLLSQGAELLVLACNTVSSFAFEAVRAHCGDIPLFEVIGPGAEIAVNRSRNSRIGVIGTRATIAGGVYEKKILQLQPKAKVTSVACPLLVPLVEEGWLRRPETGMIVRKYMLPLKNMQIDTLILGCTHYPVLKDLIQRKIGKRVVLIDSAQTVAETIRHYLGRPAVENINRQVCLDSGRCRIFVTDTAEQFRKTAHLILKEKVAIGHADLHD